MSDMPPRSYARVPTAAFGPTLGQDGYVLDEIGDRLFWLADGFYQMMFLVTSDGVVAVDAPPSLGHNIRRAIRLVTSAEVTHAIYTHSHADHTGAMVIYEDAELYAQEEAAALLKRDRDPNRPVPGHTFVDSLTLNVAGEILQLDYHGPNHAPGNTYVYAPKQQTLMLVDVVFPGWVPFGCLAVSQDIPAWLAAPAKALNYPFEHFVGGHLNRLGTREDVAVHQEFVEDLKAECERVVDASTLTHALEVVDRTNLWSIFRRYLDGMCADVSEALLPRWRDQLGGVDVFTDLNAFTMIESLRLDYGRLGPFSIRD